MECDPSIKAIILKIDQDRHNYIVEDLDDQTLVIKEDQLSSLKARLEEVRHVFWFPYQILMSGFRSLQTPSRCQKNLVPIEQH